MGQETDVTAIPVTELANYVEQQVQARLEAERDKRTPDDAKREAEAAKLPETPVEITDVKRSETIGNLMVEARNEKGERLPAVVRQRDADIHLQTFRLVRATVNSDRYQIRDIQRNMQRMGFYPEVPAAGGTEQRVMLTDPEGQPFLPVLVADTIEELREQFGLGRQLATVWQMSSGTLKVPNTTNRPRVYGVNEGAIILSRKPDFAEVLLDPKKWGVIIPYSQEMSDEAGAQWMPKVIDQVGRAFAEAEDETIWIADGSAQYHGIKGLFNLDTPLESVVLTGGLESATRNDLVDMMVAAHYGARGEGSVYAFHPDGEYVFAKWEDSAGRPYYPVNESITRMIRPLRYTAALPGIGTQATGDDLATFGDHSSVNVGVKQGISMKLLDQSTIQDVDDSTLIHLGAQDSLALRFTARWDVQISPNVQANLSKLTAGTVAAGAGAANAPKQSTPKQSAKK